MAKQSGIKSNTTIYMVIVSILVLAVIGIAYLYLQQTGAYDYLQHNYILVTSNVSQNATQQKFVISSLQNQLSSDNLRV